MMTSASTTAGRRADARRAAATATVAGPRGPGRNTTFTNDRDGDHNALQHCHMHMEHGHGVWWRGAEAGRGQARLGAAHATTLAPASRPPERATTAPRPHRPGSTTSWSSAKARMRRDFTAAMRSARLFKASRSGSRTAAHVSAPATAAQARGPTTRADSLSAAC